MIRDANNIIPVSMAVLLHVILLGSMVIAFDFARTMPITPLAIRATLVTEIPETLAPQIFEPEPEPVAEEPEPIIEEPEPEPDNSEELRQAAEEEKRRLDALVEKERLEKIRQQEEADQKRKEEAEAERKRKEREEADRARREEEEKERKRIEAEQKRQDDMRRQREENERVRREMEAEQRQSEIDAEEQRIASSNSPEMAAYQFAISQKIRRYWSVPASASSDTVCTVRVRQLRNGEIVGVNIVNCNGDEAVRRSVEAAIYRSSPLPAPSNPTLFRADLELNLRPE